MHRVALQIHEIEARRAVYLLVQVTELRHTQTALVPFRVDFVHFLNVPFPVFFGQRFKRKLALRRFLMPLGAEGLVHLVSRLLRMLFHVLVPGEENEVIDAVQNGSRVVVYSVISHIM